MTNVVKFTDFITESINKQSIYDGVNNNDINEIISNAKYWKTKEMYGLFPQHLTEFMNKEYNWKVNSEFADKMYGECKHLNFIQSITIYHEIVEYLVSNGSENFWDYSHPIAVEITSNKLKIHIHELIKYSNDDIYQAEFYTSYGQLKTGNPFLDNLRYRTEYDELSIDQIEIVDILNKSYKPLFTSTMDLFNDLIANR